MKAFVPIEKSVLATLLLALILVSCENDLEKAEKVPMPHDAAERTVEHAEYFYSDSGIVRNRLRAGLLEEFFTDTQRTELSRGVELMFFRAKGVEGSVLTAQEGSIMNNGQLMEVRQNVRFENYKGEILETEQLIWSQDSDLVYTHLPVKIIREQDTIYGIGLDANEDFSRYTLKKITGKLYVETDEQDQ